MTDRRAFYEKRASYRPWESQRYDQHWLRRYCGFLVSPGARVLEVGCGLGDLLASLKSARGPGIDSSPAMVTLARQRHPELEFRVAEALELSVEERLDAKLSRWPGWFGGRCLVVLCLHSSASPDAAVKKSNSTSP